MHIQYRKIYIYISFIGKKRRKLCEKYYASNPKFLPSINNLCFRCIYIHIYICKQVFMKSFIDIIDKNY